MKPSQFFRGDVIRVILCGLAAGMILLVVWQKLMRGSGPRHVVSPSITNAQDETRSSAETRTPLQLPVDPRPEVQLLYKMAMAANLYDFNPQIVGIRTNAKPKLIDVGTPTHGACLAGGRLERLYSYYNGSDTRRKPEAANQWYRCTGKWSEVAAITETLEILRRLGDSEALAAIVGGRQKCEAYPLRVTTPDGNQMEVTPFYKVELSDKNGRTVVQAEFRMGTNGPAGLTDWYCWP